MFTYPGTVELKTPWWIEDWDHERDDAVVIGVEPADALGVDRAFLGADSAPRGASGVAALPDRESFAVLCAGAAYRVLAASPHWEEISGGGVEAPVVVEDHELVLFTEHTGISAYGRDGLAWRTGRLVWDDLHALRVEGSTLIAEGFDPPSGRTVPFAVTSRREAPTTRRTLTRALTDRRSTSSRSRR